MAHVMRLTTVMKDATMRDRFLPGVPTEQITEIYNAAPGNEITSGKFDSAESSAALVANAFGFFLNSRVTPVSGPCRGD